ncbi:MAG TPA: mechanosensitive ion channel, partial [Planctomycetota bacterium]|nr:mechanosensitive ion channel [Planctomycetota bacterium]
LSKMLGTLTYVLILVPVLVASLNALELEAISAPASDMLDQFLGALPNLFAALIVIALAWVVGRLVATLVANLLSGVGFDLILERLGLSRASEEAPAPVEGRSPSSIAGFLVLLAIMLVASMEAFRLVGFDALAELIHEFYLFAGNVLLGLVILALGLWAANVVHQRVRASATANAGFLALAARVAILVVAAAMAIQQMGVGSEVTNLVLAALLGAVAVALALAFGLGARDSAGRLVEDWLKTRRAKT